MNDPHVESLRYLLKVDEQHGRFDNPPPLEYETEAFKLRLENDVLIVEMKEHHPSVQSAKLAVDPMLRDWELYTALERSHRWMSFIHDHTGDKMVDRDPPPPRLNQVILSYRAVAQAATASYGIIIQPPAFREYPKPPAGFKSSEDLVQCFKRYQNSLYLDESQLTSVGYLCLSYLKGTVRLNNRGKKRKKEVRDEVNDM